MAGLFAAFDVTASGLSGMRRKMDNTAANIANAETTRTPEGGPYRRRVTAFRAQPEKGAFADQRSWCFRDRCRRARAATR